MAKVRTRASRGSLRALSGQGFRTSRLAEAWMLPEAQCRRSGLRVGVWGLVLCGGSLLGMYAQQAKTDAKSALTLSRKKRRPMSASVKMLWGGRRGYGTFGAVQRPPKERP